MLLVALIGISFLIFSKELLFLFLMTISGLIAFINIYLYHDRKLQFVINRLNIILNLITLGIVVYGIINQSDYSFDFSYSSLSRLAPIVSIVFLFLANRSIHRDEELVRSSDRIR